MVYLLLCLAAVFTAARRGGGQEVKMVLHLTLGFKEPPLPF